MKQLGKTARRTSRGFTLVELMIALVLGLVVTGAAISAFVSSKRVYATTESLGRVQENARAAFELMARDIREAGGNACNSELIPTNVLNNPTALSYTHFGGGVIGYVTGAQAGIPSGGAERERVGAADIGAGNYSEAIVLKSATGGGIRIDPDNSANVNIGTFEPIPTDWVGAIVMACDPEHAAIFQVTAIDSSPHGVKIQTSKSISPGNATNCMAPGMSCPSGNPKRYTFGCTQGWWEGGKTYPNRPKGCVYEGAPPAVLARLQSISWYVGKGTKSGNSLYRRVDGPSAVADEIAEHVRSLAFEYLLDGNYVSANTVPDDDAWARVTAVRIKLTFEGEDLSAGMGGQGLARELAATVALRNRLQ